MISLISRSQCTCDGIFEIAMIFEKLYHLGERRFTFTVCLTRYSIHWSNLEIPNPHPSPLTQYIRAKLPTFLVSIVPARVICTLMSKASADENSGNGKKAAATGSGKDNIIPIPEDEADLVKISQLPRDLHNFDITNKVLVGRICTSLKRNRVPGVSLDEVEEELVRRKKMKKESWYDQDGNLICVNVSSIHGNQTFMVEEEGVLMPLSK